MGCLSKDLEIAYKIKELISLKEQIKNEVVNPSLTWQERMELYKKVQNINEQIKELEEVL